MRSPNPELEEKILMSAIELMMEKEPSEIGMRDVAKKCDVSATAIYHYYKDKNELFMKISLFFLNELNSLMTESIERIADCKEKVRAALKTYRDWCFEKPKIAMLLFSKLEEEISQDEIQNFYICNRMGESLLEECKSNGCYKGRDIKMDTGIMISGLWGCIESILTKRADPMLWEQKEKFTDYFIEIMMNKFLENKTV